MATHYLACDLGAESGRLMLGTLEERRLTLEERRLTLEELHRFPNVPIQESGSMYWDIPALIAGLKAGLIKAATRNVSIASISTDAWGVDYMLFDAGGVVMPPTFHYRDPRTARGVANVKARIDWKTIFAETGIQFMPLNTIYQLAAEAPGRLARARQLLLIGDAFNFLLSGVARAEESMASTSQLYNPRTQSWSMPLLKALDLPAGLFPPIVPAGTRLGPLKASWQCGNALAGLEVIATCSHDTGAAVAAVPATGENWAYLSSGTWSLMGVELPAPIITEACRELNFTNEIGYGGTVRLLKNIVGLWIVQECRRDWAGRGRDYDYAELTRMASAAPPFVSLINPDDPRFLSPGDLPAKVAAFCRETGQPAPADPGATTRCVLESLALLYRRTLSRVEQLVGRKIERVHIVGGGSRNTLLNQFTANALQIPVLAGPAEATALGNILVQAITLGHLPSLEAARDVVHATGEIKEVLPRDGEVWELASQRFARLKARQPDLK